MMMNNESRIENEELEQVNGSGMFSWMAFSHGHKTKQKASKAVQETAAPRLRAPKNYHVEDDQPWDPLGALAGGDNML